MISHRKEDMCWVDPFVGGANMIDKVEGWRIGSDDEDEECVYSNKRFITLKEYRKLKLEAINAR
jgi:hypothetical protein